MRLQLADMWLPLRGFGRTGVIVDGPEGPVQTAAFEIDGDVIRALYVVRNSNKLRHLAAASAPHERGPG